MLDLSEALDIPIGVQSVATDPFWLDQTLANYKAYGFVVSNTAQACDPNKTPHDTALLCSPPDYVTPDADQTYAFADDLHFTTHMHALFAQYVEQQLASHGITP